MRTAIIVDTSENGPSKIGEPNFAAEAYFISSSLTSRWGETKTKGSTGWGYVWDEDEVSPLRSHFCPFTPRLGLGPTTSVKSCRTGWDPILGPSSPSDISLILLGICKTSDHIVNSRQTFIKFRADFGPASFPNTGYQARKTILRTHTTAVSSRTLYEMGQEYQKTKVWVSTSSTGLALITSICSQGR